MWLFFFYLLGHKAHQYLYHLNSHSRKITDVAIINLQQCFQFNVHVWQGYKCVLCRLLTGSSNCSYITLQHFRALFSKLLLSSCIVFFVFFTITEVGNLICTCFIYSTTSPGVTKKIKIKLNKKNLIITQGILSSVAGMAVNAMWCLSKEWTGPYTLFSRLYFNIWYIYFNVLLLKPACCLFLQRRDSTSFGWRNTHLLLELCYFMYLKHKKLTCVWGKWLTSH